MGTRYLVRKLWLALYPFIYLKLMVMKIRAMFWCEYAYKNHPFFKPIFRSYKTYGGRTHVREYWIKYLNPQWNDNFELVFYNCRPEILSHPIFDESRVPKIKRKSN